MHTVSYTHALSHTFLDTPSHTYTDTTLSDTLSLAHTLTYTQVINFNVKKMHGVYFLSLGAMTLVYH